jgi:P27 family predicted phage terminase small subunit
MGNRGPQPTPTAKLKLSGSWLAAAREKAGEPRLPTAIPDVPADVGGDRLAKRFWCETAPLLHRMGVLTAADAGVLAQYCLSRAELLRATRALRRCKYDRGTNERRRMSADVAELRGAVLRFGAKLGLSPADRTSLRAEKHADASDPMERLLAKQG